jgi:hypothetical protein
LTWTGSIWFMIGTSSGLLWTRLWTLPIPIPPAAPRQLTVLPPTLLPSVVKRKNIFYLHTDPVGYVTEYTTHNLLQTVVFMQITLSINQGNNKVRSNILNSEC